MQFLLKSPYDVGNFRICAFRITGLYIIKIFVCSSQANPIACAVLLEGFSFYNRVHQECFPSFKYKKDSLHACYSLKTVNSLYVVFLDAVFLCAIIRN